jgi:hypothetical protein
MSACERFDKDAELHLVVIWSAARHAEARILADLREHLEICRVHEVHWSPELVRQNYARFYRGRLVPPYRNVRLRKGNGPHLVVTALDRAPRYAMRETLHGPAVVNATLFDAKLRYRSWTGTGHLVHGSDSAAEARRDLMLLLGFTTGEYLPAHAGAWDGTVRPVRRDLSGARGWASPAELARALDCAVDYLVLAGAEALRGPGGQWGEEVELLTNNYLELIAVTNARPRLRQIPRWGGRFLIPIAGREVACGFRFVGDGYFDPAWQRAVLERRAADRDGFYLPAPDDALETLAYHALVHQPALSERHRERLVAMARGLGRPGWTRAALEDPRRVKVLLDGMLAARGYAYVRPRDRMVVYNFAAVGAHWPAARRVLADLEASFTGQWRLWAAEARARYFGARDLLARSAPWARRLLRRGRRPRPGFQPPTAAARVAKAPAASPAGSEVK